MSRLHLHAWGPGEATPLLVVHGVSNSGARYRRLAAEQLPGFRVVAPDLRGHGRSTWEPPWSVAANVAGLAAVVEAWTGGPVAVAGHSFGGLIAMALAAARPELVERLALIDPAVAVDPAEAAARAEGFRRDEGWARPEEARAARLALRPEGARDTVDEDLATFMDECEDGRWRFRFSRTAAVTAWSEMAGPVPSLAGWPGRALLIAATGPDAMVTERLRAGLRADLGDRLGEAAIDAGHMLFWDAPGELGALLRGFLA
jgi:lipase